MSRQIVKENIPVGGVWAATRGQTVDSDWVEANGWHDFVVGENTKEGREIKADVTGRPAADFETAGTGTATTARAAKSTGSDAAPSSTKEG